ncbi:hypothetical protein [Larkinella knui]
MITKLHNRYEALDSLIRKRATGSPKELAQKLGIGELIELEISLSMVHN